MRCNLLLPAAACGILVMSILLCGVPEFRWQLTNTIRFPVTQLFKDPVFLQQKYVVERHSAAEIGEEITSARGAALKYLRLARIPIRPADKNTRSRLAYGEPWKGGVLTRIQKTILALSSNPSTLAWIFKIADCSSASISVYSYCKR